MTIYSQCFWDSNLATSNGFDILVDHMSKNFEIISTIINLLEHKVSSDDLHARAQSKIAKSYTKQDKDKDKDKEKSSKNDEIIKKIAEKIDKEANERILQCDKIKTDVIDSLKEYMKVNYDRFKKAKTDCSKANKERKSAFDQVQKSVKSLNVKIKSHEGLVKKNAGIDDEKTKAKIHKSFASVKACEKEMVTAVSNMNSSIFSWRSQLESFCNVVEELDLLHHTIIKQRLESLSLILTDFSTSYKSIQAEIGYLSEDIDPKSMIEQFAQDKKTNEVLPSIAYTYQKNDSGFVEYVLDFSTDKNSSNQHVPFGGNSTDTSYQSNTRSFKSAENEISTSNWSESQNDVTSYPNPPPPINDQSNSISGYVIAQYDYAAQADDELTFTYGDRIKIIFKEDDSWYMGELENGTRGIFPITYVIPE